jgi:prepilin-type N-terminal cleavage/methylation domain-containing protein
MTLGDRRFSRAFTLIEGIVVVAILAILVTIVFKYSSGWIGRVEGVRCANNMRSLQVSLASYVQDVGHWPQEPPENSDTSNNDASEDWWLNELKGFGATPEVWMCPSVKRLISKRNSDGRPKISYTPTPFDESPFTPYKWSTQPWLIEIGNMHGRGALICYPDGSIKSMDDVVELK